VPEPIQSPSGTGRRTEAFDEGEAAAARREGLVVLWPVEDVRGGMALGDWRKTLLELGLEGVGMLPSSRLLVPGGGVVLRRASRLVE
jgi:hypothetical protein